MDWAPTPQPYPTFPGSNNAQATGHSLTPTQALLLERYMGNMETEAQRARAHLGDTGWLSDRCPEMIRPHPRWLG